MNKKNTASPISALPIMEANAREVHAIEYLAGLDCQLIHDQEMLKERLSLIPNGWRNFRLALTTTEKLIDAVYETLPTKTLLHMERLSKYGEVIIRPKPLIKMPNDVQIVSKDDLIMLLNTTIASECALCVKDATEQKKCKLRKCLMNVAPTGALRPDGLCSYIDVVTGNELGQYI